MVKQIINPERQEKKRIMKKLSLTGKQYRKWLKKKRKEGKVNENSTSKGIR